MSLDPNNPAFKKVTQATRVILPLGVAWNVTLECGHKFAMQSPSKPHAVWCPFCDGRPIGNAANDEGTPP